MSTPPITLGDDQTLVNIEDANHNEQDLHSEFSDPTDQSPSAVYYRNLKAKRLPPKAIDVKKFVEATASKPILTRALIQNAVEQLEKAKKKERVEFLDCYGEIHRFETREAVEMQNVPTLFYNSYHDLADHNPHSMIKDLPVQFQDDMLDHYSAYHELNILITNSKLPIYINFEEPFDGVDYKRKVITAYCTIWRDTWKDSYERQKLVKSLHAMKRTASVTRIHLAALKISRKLGELHKRAGMAVNDPINIFAQDLAHTPNDIKILARFEPPITVLNDPEAFLAITSSTLVIACCPTVPVKQIVADLSAEDPSARPTAMFWNNSEFDEQLGVDEVKYPVHRPIHYANPVSRRLMDMLEKGYRKGFDGEERPSCACKCDEGWTGGTRWLVDMEMWLKRKEE